jgi:PAS domain S-box-containing protein
MTLDAKRFRQLNDKVTDFAIFFTTPDGVIDEWNVGAERLFGFTRAEAIGQPGEIIFLGKDRANNVPAEEMNTAAKNGVAEDERWHLRKDGSTFFASGLMHALFEDGVLSGFVKIVRDLTERVEIESALSAAQVPLTIEVVEQTSEIGERNKVLRLALDARRRGDVLKTRMVRKVLAGQEEERKRISRDIHDHLGQEVTGLRLRLQALSEKLRKLPGDLVEDMNFIQDAALRLDASVDFIAWELRPAQLEELGFEEALERYVREWSAKYKTKSHVNIERKGGRRLALETEINLYRVVQEALNNVSKHAKAANVSITLARPNGTVLLTVQDDGAGFDVSSTTPGRSLGLTGMGERAALLGGEVEILSTRGKGTSVSIRVPAVTVETDTPL